MKKGKAVPRLIRQFLKNEEMTPKELAEVLNIAESTVHRWLGGEVKPTGTAASILWTLISLSLAPDEETGKGTAGGKELSAVTQAIAGAGAAGALGAGLASGLPVAGSGALATSLAKLPALGAAGASLASAPPVTGAAALATSLVKLPTLGAAGASVAFSAGLPALGSILGSAVTPVGIPLAAVLSGLAIYKFLKKKLEKKSEQELQAMEEIYRALLEQNEHLERIRMLEEQLEAEKEKLRQIAGGSEQDDVLQ